MNTARFTSNQRRGFLAAWGGVVLDLVGIGIDRYESLGVPVALTAIRFVLGLLLLPLAIETRGQPLPL